MKNSSGSDSFNEVNKTFKKELIPKPNSSKIRKRRKHFPTNAINQVYSDTKTRQKL